MTTAVHDHQLVLVGADPQLLAQLDLERAERLVAIRHRREERRLAQRARARCCRCAKPWIFDRDHCTACGHDIHHTEEAA
jgi:hypothetical protein